MLDKTNSRFLMSSFLSVDPNLKFFPFLAVSLQSGFKRPIKTVTPLPIFRPEAALEVTQCAAVIT